MVLVPFKWHILLLRPLLLGVKSTSMYVHMLRHVPVCATMGSSMGIFMLSFRECEQNVEKSLSWYPRHVQTGLCSCVCFTWRYTIAGLDWWTGLVDWTGGLVEIVPRPEFQYYRCALIRIIVTKLGPWAYLY